MSEGDAPNRAAPGLMRFVPLALLLIVALPVVSKFSNDFVYDDVPMIVESDFIHDPANISSAFLHHTMVASADHGPRPVDTYRPVTLSTFFWDAQISGRDPFSYHLTNLLLHLLTVALLFLLARRLIGDATWAGFAALFFGLSPWLAEAHVWINGRSDPVCTAFGLGAMLVYARALDTTGPRRILGLVGSALLFFLGLLSKEVLLLLVPAIVLMPGLEHRLPTLGSRLRASFGFFVAALSYLVLRTSVLSGMRAVADASQLQLAASRLPILLLDGLVHLVAPPLPYLRSMAEDYDRLPTIVLIAAGALVALLAYAAFRFRRRAPLVSFGLLVFAPTLAPAAVIATMSWGGFGRYLYLPAVGIAIAVAAAARALFERERTTDRHRRLLRVGLVGYLTVLAAILAMSVGGFRDQETLYSSAMRAAPNNALAFSLLAAERERQGHFEDAQDLYEGAVKRDPARPKYIVGLAGVHLAQGDAAGARALAEAGLSRVPPSGGADFHALIVASAYTEDPAVAVEHLLECLRYQPGSFACRRWANVLMTHPALSAHYRPLLLEAAGRQEPDLTALLDEITEEAPPAVAD